MADLKDELARGQVQDLPLHEAEAQRIIDEAKRRIEVIARTQVHGGMRPTMRPAPVADDESTTA